MSRYAPSMTSWPELRLDAWRDTYATLLLYTQIVGKVRLALTPKMNQWWNVTLYLTSRGLTTSPMPIGERTVSIDFDFIDHRLILQDSDGQIRSFPLVARLVCDFHDQVLGELAAMGVHVSINPMPQECPVTTPLSEDRAHSSYDAERAHDIWRALQLIEPVFQTFRARFRGKCSPVHFFWGSFDLAVTRFNGRRAPPRAGLVERDAYDEEVISLGFWPGDPWAGTSEPFFYSYIIPAPEGLASQRIRPDAASYSDQWKEFILPYDAVRRSRDPAEDILDFAQSAYDAGANLAGWNRAALAYP